MGSLKLLISFVMATLLASNVAAQSNSAIARDAATQSGTTLGKALNPGLYQTITTGNPATVVPGYNTNPSQAQYFQNGNGTTVGPGSARVQGCTSQSDVECQAVNLLQQGPKTRPQMNLAGDPLIGRARSLNNTAPDVVGDMFSQYSSCHTTQVTVPPIFETQVCNDFSYIETKTCKMGQEVIVDPNYLYKCLQTIQAQSNATCTIGRVVQVDANYSYQCHMSKAVETYRCRRTASVTASNTPSCNLGQTIQATPGYQSSLGQDPCQGGDYLYVYYTCQITNSPNITLATNVKGAPNAQWTYPANFGNQEVYFSNCKANLTGNTNCANGQCTGSYSAAMYYQGYGYRAPTDICYRAWWNPGQAYTNWGEGQAYDVQCNGYIPLFQVNLNVYPDSNYWTGWPSGTPTGYLEGSPYGLTWVYSGTLQVNTGFQLYTQSVNVGPMINGCTALENRAK
jgi:hypothetical protein